MLISAMNNMPSYFSNGRVFPQLANDVATEEMSNDAQELRELMMEEDHSFKERCSTL